MMLKSLERNLGVLKRSEILLRILNGAPLEEVYSGFSARQMQDLRNFLEKEVHYLSSLKDENALTIAEIKTHYEKIPNYYYRQDCREPLESCFNETCLASNPGCFSNKMKGQIQVLYQFLRKYLNLEKAGEEGKEKEK